MNILSWFTRKQSSAGIASERLKILLSHERVANEGDATLIAEIKEDILAVISKRIKVDPDKVRIEMERDNGFTSIGIDIEVPAKKPPKRELPANSNSQVQTLRRA